MTPLVLLPYYDRPMMVRTALRSLLTQDCDWRLFFVDDGSAVPGEPIVREVLHDFMDRVSLVRLDDTVEMKKRNGSRHGYFLNSGVEMADLSPEDPVVYLCDDDALVPGYLPALCAYYERFPKIPWSYCHVCFFSPETGLPNVLPHDLKHSLVVEPVVPLNSSEEPLAPSCRLDASQVTFRRKCITPQVRFPENQAANLDMVFFEKAVLAWGLCHFNGLVGEFKAIHEDQLGRRTLAGTYEVKAK